MVYLSSSRQALRIPERKRTNYEKADQDRFRAGAAGGADAAADRGPGGRYHHVCAHRQHRAAAPAHPAQRAGCVPGAVRQRHAHYGAQHPERLGHCDGGRTERLYAPELPYRRSSRGARSHGRALDGGDPRAHGGYHPVRPDGQYGQAAPAGTAHHCLPVPGAVPQRHRGAGDGPGGQFRLRPGGRTAGLYDAAVPFRQFPGAGARARAAHPSAL